ncbi:MAG: hypothetical protein QOI09_172 [Chloroflexota bacterium]|jgi:hypothetical protein|nr:hypothetical protein [Chloroflexota bacterium]
MFHSTVLAKAIQDDRVREIERTIRDRRLMEAANETATPAFARSTPARSVGLPTSAARGDSACEPA